MNLFEDFKLLFNSDIQSFKKIDKNNTWVLNFWIGNNKSNLGLFLKIEEQLLSGVPKKLALMNLFLCVNKKTRFIKFPKAKKAEYELEWLIPFFKNFYGWSNNEISVIWGVIIDKLKDTNTREIIAKQFGLENRDRKKLDLKPLNKKIVKPKIPTGQRRLF